jgi:hypothetical protein
VKRYVAIHEAGHAVVADALGFRVILINACERGYHTGFLHATASRGAEQQFALATVSLAGGAAELRLGRRVPGDGNGPDILDAEKHARAYLRHTARRRTDTIAVTMRRAGWLAQSIVNDRWSAIRALAAHLVEHGAADEKTIARHVAAWSSTRARMVRGRGVCPELGR